MSMSYYVKYTGDIHYYYYCYYYYYYYYKCHGLECCHHSGRLFHTRAAATGKARSLRVASN